jgi:hypothetical protein
MLGGGGDGVAPADLSNARRDPWFHLYHSAPRARIMAGLSGFLTLSQSRDGPDR